MEPPESTTTECNFNLCSCYHYVTIAKCTFHKSFATRIYTSETLSLILYVLLVVRSTLEIISNFRHLKFDAGQLLT